MRRPPHSFAHRPVDARSRLVIGTEPKGTATRLHLDCGHSISRRMLCAPTRVICNACPADDGLGGYVFEVKRHQRARA